MINLAESRLLADFQSLYPITQYTRILCDNGFSKSIEVSYTLIAYFLDGKSITEGLGHSLDYFAAVIHLQKKKYPVAECVKVMVTE